MGALYIPAKICVGFQNRQGTFTGKLAYVIYYDEKGKLRKQTSWDGWRDKSIAAVEFDNVPTTGFIFNKGVQRSGDWFGTGRSLVRIYDPRDFEFEISIDNVVNILMHSDVSKRDIVEPCVFAWDGTNLVLLPTNSTEYQKSVEYSAKQSGKISAKDFVPGRRYYVKKDKENAFVTYLGRFDLYEFNRYSYNNDDRSFGTKSKGKQHVFCKDRDIEKHFNPQDVFVTMKPDQLAGAVSDDIADNYAELVEKFQSSIRGNPVVGVNVIPFDIDAAVENFSSWHRPTLYRINGNVIERLQISCYSRDKFIDLSANGYGYNQFSVEVLELETFLNEKKDFRLNYRTTQSRGGYYSRGYQTNVRCHSQEEKIIKTLRESVAPGQLKEVPCRNFYEIASQLGYGTLVGVLANGNTTPKLDI